MRKMKNMFGTLSGIFSLFGGHVNKLFVFILLMTLISITSKSQDKEQLDSLIILLKNVISKKTEAKVPSLVLRFPLEKQTYRMGDTMYVLWDIKNIDSVSEKSTVKLEISFDNEATWENIGESEMKKGVYKWSVKNNVKSNICVIKCTPDDKSIKEAKSKKFSINTQSDYINIGIGTNFNFADEQNRFKGIYFAINSSFPSLFKIGKNAVGLDLYFAQGFNSYYDSLYQYISDTNRMDVVKKRDNRNIYAAATLYFSLSKNWRVILPHIEFRHTSSSLYIRNNNRLNFLGRSSSNSDTLIKTRDSSVFNQQSILTTNYFNGLGLAFNFQNDLFDINVKGLVGYDLGSLGFDYLIRFYLRNRITGATIGGDFRGPFGRKTDRFVLPQIESRPRVFEVLIYGSVDVDIFSTIKNGINR